MKNDGPAPKIPGHGAQGGVGVRRPWVLSDRNMGASAQLWLTLDKVGLPEPAGSPAMGTVDRKWKTSTGAGSGSPHFLLFWKQSRGSGFMGFKCAM